ncbi:MAG: type II toxin-antitoxin system RelE/ParE family toxin [Deltaproteobacteria bacterium]|nr:type II toxin-antitoxin system RelE/ParE family toxin [Deltaproteobacteria bacterium]
MSKNDKPLVWLKGEVKTPPFSSEARIEAGYLLRCLQQGKKLSLPESRPMPSIGKSCHELKIIDQNVTWRIVYRLNKDAVIILAVFKKKTQKTPKEIIDVCQSRLKNYDSIK